MLERQRLVYNAALQEWIGSWRWACAMAARLGLARYDRKVVEAILPEELDTDRAATRENLLAWRPVDWWTQAASLTLRAQRDVLGEVVLDDPAVVTRQTLTRLDEARRAFKRCVAGGTPVFPRFRGRGRWSTFGLSEMRDAAFVRPKSRTSGRRASGGLRLPGVGRAISVRTHRDLPDGTQVRAATLTLRDRRWCVALQCRVPRLAGVEPDCAFADLADDQVVGLDWGDLPPGIYPSRFRV